MKLVKRTSGYYSNIYLMLLMAGTAPTTAAELKSRVNIYSLEDMFNHVDRVGYFWACQQGQDLRASRYLKQMHSPVLRKSGGFCPDRMYRIDPTTFVSTPITNTGLGLVKQGLTQALAQADFATFVRGTLDQLMGWEALTPNLAFEYQWDDVQTFNGYTVGAGIIGGSALGEYLYVSVYAYDESTSQWVQKVNSASIASTSSAFYSLTPFQAKKLRVVYKTYQQPNSDRVGGCGGVVKPSNTAPAPVILPDIKWALAINCTHFSNLLVQASDPVPLLCCTVGGPEAAGEITLSQNLGVQSDAQINMAASFISLGDME